jgi:hypothetical protein
MTSMLGLAMVAYRGKSLYTVVGEARERMIWGVQLAVLIKEHDPQNCKQQGSINIVALDDTIEAVTE